MGGEHARQRQQLVQEPSSGEKTCLLEKLAGVENEGEGVMRSSWSRREGDIAWGRDTGVGRSGSDPHKSSQDPQGFKPGRDRIGFACNSCHGLCVWHRNGFEGSGLEEGRPGGGPCRSLWCIGVFRKLLEREGRPWKTVRFRAKPWKDIKQLSASTSLVPDGDTRVPVLWL